MGQRLAKIPVLAVYGDHLGLDARWPRIRERTDIYFASARAAGASVDIIDLPTIGIHGNSHMLMMERNNTAIADLWCCNGCKAASPPDKRILVRI